MNGYEMLLIALGAMLGLTVLFAAVRGLRRAAAVVNEVVHVDASASMDFDED